MNQAHAWDRIYADPQFNQLVVKRRKVTLKLFLICMIFFFSIPFFSVVSPSFLRIQVMGAINVGLLLVVAQYVVGGLIAWRYVIELKKIDEMSKQLISTHAENS
ncbi:DUF485 domain-containing protein [Acinetobacter rathckeae]|uniref:DUF485 domain-containing protein n=1 Tax=Acinetobacter rathckeae TaxID=2605272 RepID=UPI0018A24B35|nr:DUF485 domain-containing protein [Acinetobacter rathckeae]MBF7688670.1 DUF485 domain-containing protein [Acinetobacter rathckeae]MBF7696063.1 DUF485 domain-containing protein [Acinetobacter rathckeae]